MYRKRMNRVAFMATILALAWAAFFPDYRSYGEVTQENDGDVGEFQDSPAQKSIHALLETLRRNDPVQTKTFLGSHLDPSFLNFVPMEDHLAAFAEMSQILGDFQVEEVEATEAGTFDLVLLSGVTDERFKLHLVMEPQSYRFVEIGMERFEAELEAAPSFRSLEDVDGYLQELVETNRFSGVVLIARNDRPQFLKAYGMANKSKGIPNKVDTRFNVGSITKLFTAVAVFQLQERGKLSVQDPIGKFLTGFPSDVADRVKIIHLLRMESGYGDYLMNPEYNKRKRAIRTVSDLLDVIRKLPLQFEPGSRQRYSNAGFAVLGGIIEKASGRGYYDYISENVFTPAGMLASGFPMHSEAGNEIAIGYTNDGPEGREDYTETNLEIFAVRGSPAGGSYSSAEDILRFDMALRKDRLLRSEYGTLLLNLFDDTKTERPKMMGFAGGAPGISAVTLANHESGWNIIVLSNYDEPIAEKIGKVIRNGIESIPSK